MDRPETVGTAAVVGAGLMGTQIAVVLCAGSERVFVMGRHEKTLQRARSNAQVYLRELHAHGLLQGADPGRLLKRIRFTQRLEQALADAQLVVESIPESLPDKQALFAQIEELVCPRCLLASNTSGLPISSLAAALRHPERLAGSHFLQPAHIVPVVEVVAGGRTARQTIDTLSSIWKSLGKIPLQVKRDVPGFLVNRLQHALIREAVRLLSQGVACAEDIDLAVRLGLGPRFATAGPLEQRDLNGLQMHRQVAEHLWRFLDGWQEPLAYLKEMVDRGNTGLESGRGFYDWSGKAPSAIRSSKNQALTRSCERALRDWQEEKNAGHGASG